MDSNELEFVSKEGFTAIGKRDYMRFLKGESLSMKQSIRAMCYSCNNLDDATNCGVSDCVLYKYHPYNPDKVNFTAGKGNHDFNKPYPRNTSLQRLEGI